jgi:hypothetical protein
MCEGLLVASQSSVALKLEEVNVEQELIKVLDQRRLHFYLDLLKLNRRQLKPFQHEQYFLPFTTKKLQIKPINFIQECAIQKKILKKHQKVTIFFSKSYKTPIEFTSLKRHDTAHMMTEGSGTLSEMLLCGST